MIIVLYLVKRGCNQAKRCASLAVASAFSAVGGPFLLLSLEHEYNNPFVHLSVLFGCVKS